MGFNSLLYFGDMGYSIFAMIGAILILKLLKFNQKYIISFFVIAIVILLCLFSMCDKTFECNGLKRGLKTKRATSAINY